MNQVSNSANKSLFIEPMDCITRLNDVLVDRGLSDASDDWKAVYRHYGDECNYLTMSFYLRPDNSLIAAIEFGVQDVDDKRAVGGFVAHWNRIKQAISTIELVVLHSKDCQLHVLVAALDDYLSLPLLCSDVVATDYE